MRKLRLDVGQCVQGQIVWTCRSQGLNRDKHGFTWVYTLKRVPVTVTEVRQSSSLPAGIAWSSRKVKHARRCVWIKLDNQEGHLDKAKLMGWDCRYVTGRQGEAYQVLEKVRRERQ